VLNVLFSPPGKQISWANNIERIVVRSGGANKAIEKAPYFVLFTFWIILQDHFHRMIESRWDGGRSWRVKS
jgi:hypothetical protein